MEPTHEERGMQSVSCVTKLGMWREPVDKYQGYQGFHNFNNHGIQGHQGIKDEAVECCRCLGACVTSAFSMDTTHIPVHKTLIGYRDLWRQ